MKTVIAMIALSTATLNVAHADGFVCQGNNTGINVKVYNQTQAAMGTRTPAIMVVSDPAIASPNKTIAKFTNANGTLTYLGYGKNEGKVDARFAETSRSGENVAGTKLGQLADITLGVNFDYYSASVAKDAEKLTAKIYYHKLNGETLEETANCARYTKNI